MWTTDTTSENFQYPGGLEDGGVMGRPCGDMTLGQRMNWVLQPLGERGGHRGKEVQPLQRL